MKKIPIIVESAEVLVADKPAGYLSVRSRLGKKDPRPCLHTELEKQYGMKLWPVHRLDFEVSGLILFAKNAAAHTVACSLFETRAIEKTYHALTEGPEPTLKEFKWENLLLRGKKRAYINPAGKQAITHAQFLERKKNYNFWEIHPHTGRSHQIRFHLFQNGFPIAGDVLYGATPILRSSEAPSSIALEATSLLIQDEQATKTLQLPHRLIKKTPSFPELR